MMERPTWQRVLYAVWPKIYRAINTTISFLLLLMKAGVRIAIKQIKQI